MLPDGRNFSISKIRIIDTNFMDTTKNIVALFDLDGVVIDSETQYTVFWNEVGRKYFPDYKDFGLMIKGQTLTQIFDKYFSDKKEVLESLKEELDAFENNMTYNYIPGVVDFMKELRNNGAKMAIVTSSNDKKMSNVYAAHPEFKDMVDRILTAEMFTRSKPAPDCFLLGAEVFNSPIENCIVFEDSFHGLQAGKSANMVVVGLSTTNSEEAIKDKCNVVIPNFLDFSYQDVLSLLEAE